MWMNLWKILSRFLEDGKDKKEHLVIIIILSIMLIKLMKHKLKPSLFFTEKKKEKKKEKCRKDWKREDVSYTLRRKKTTHLISAPKHAKME